MRCRPYPSTISTVKSRREYANVATPFVALTIFAYTPVCVSVFHSVLTLLLSSFTAVFLSFFYYILISIHYFLTELLFLVGNVVDVVEIHTQAFRQKKKANESALGSVGTGSDTGGSKVVTSFDTPIDPAAAWTLKSDGTVKEKGDLLDEDEDEDNSDSDAKNGKLDEEEREFTLQMAAEGFSDEVMRVKLQTWRAQYRSANDGKDNKRNRKQKKMMISMVALKEEEALQREIEHDDHFLHTCTR